MEEKLYRVVNSDNFGSDYPDECFVGEPMTLEEAKKLVDELDGNRLYDPRYHKVVEADYKLQPGFTP